MVFLVHVAAHNLPLLLEALGSVDTELARIHYALRDFAAWPSPESPDLLRARAAIRRAFAGLRSIRELVVGTTDGSLESRASALRARGIVVLLQLAELRGADAFQLLGATFSTVEAFTAYVLDEVGHANTIWVGRCDDLAAIECAERAFGLIGRDPLVATVLARGSCSRERQTRVACSTIAALLDHRVTGCCVCEPRCATSTPLTEVQQ